MDLTWMVVAIAGCVALAVCIAAVLLRPMDAQRRRLRPLANVGRLTLLPEYVRAKRARTRAAVITIGLLVVMFACSIIVAARPTGSFTSARPFDGEDPEDVMLCIGAPVTDDAATATLRYVTEHADDFTTERIGLTSPNRRVVPLTRDYQYVKETFSNYAQQPGPRGDLTAFSPAVSYSDYAESVEDQLALCLTGFPDFEQEAAQRRSLIYVGPGERRAPDDGRPALFTADRVRDVARAAGVQVNVLVTGPDSTVLSSLARDTGGQAFSAESGVAAHLAEIRAAPPRAGSSDDRDADGRSTESPDVPLVVGLLAAVALAAWPVVARR
ncbi:MAG: hypothetical protein ABW001_15660 [Mycobacterium sp.]